MGQEKTIYISPDVLSAATSKKNGVIRAEPPFPSMIKKKKKRRSAQRATS